MAEEKQDNKDAKSDPPEAAAAPKSKKPQLLGGGLLAVLALAWIGATMAVPKVESTPVLVGPFVAKLSPKELQVNLQGDKNKRYLVMSLSAECYAYDEAWVHLRTGSPDSTGAAMGSGDPLYIAQLMDTLLALSSARTVDEVTDPVLVDGFLEEIRQTIEPVLFPVVLDDPSQGPSASGLRPGESILESTMRGYLHEHTLRLNSALRAVSLDDGQPVPFSGNESDLCVKGPDGSFVFLDVTQVAPNFDGELPVGVMGKIRRLYRDSYAVQ